MGTPRNCTKMLRNLTFVVQFADFSIRPKKFCNKQLLSNVLRYYGKIFGKSRAHAKYWGANMVYYGRCANGEYGEEKIRKLLS